jgi:hypothetical protein
VESQKIKMILSFYVRVMRNMPQSITTDCDDLPDDLPALICISCDKVATIGGHLWEDEHPSTEMCDCDVAKQLLSIEDCLRWLREHRW